MTQCFKIIWQTGMKKSLGIIVQVHLNLTTPSIQSHVINNMTLISFGVCIALRQIQICEYNRIKETKQVCVPKTEVFGVRGSSPP